MSKYNNERPPEMLAQALANYKKSQAKRAQNQGVLAELQNAKTLTQARKILRNERY